MSAPAGFKLFDVDDATGISTYHRFEDGVRHMFYEQDVEPILDTNKAERYNAKGKACERGRMGFKVASIPIIVQMKWLTEYGVDVYSPDPGQQKKVRELLNSREWMHLRQAELQL